MASPYDLSGRVALVTGGTRGIGRAAAFALARAGARVAVSSRKQDAVDETVASIVAASGQAVGVVANVGRLAEAHDLIDRVAAHCGRLDILVNNAGTNPVYGAAEDMTPEVYAKIFDVNLRGPFELAKRALPLMKTSGGSIINVSSIGGLSPEPGLGLYSVSKAALISLTQVMAREWGSFGVRANAICPGFIKTDMTHRLWSNASTTREVLSRTPLSRLGTPDEVAELIVFLASDAASYCTGGVYMVDGGYSV